jgi:hypothetical protein
MWVPTILCGKYCCFIYLSVLFLPFPLLSLGLVCQSGKTCFVKVRALGRVSQDYPKTEVLE